MNVGQKGLDVGVGDCEDDMKRASRPKKKAPLKRWAPKKRGPKDDAGWPKLGRNSFTGGQLARQGGGLNLEEEVVRGVCCRSPHVKEL